MNEKTIYIDKKTMRQALRRARMRTTMNNVKKWIVRNQDWLVIVTPTVVGTVAAAAKVAARAIGNHAKVKKVKDTKNLYCYDRSLGHYWKLKRELTNADWVKIDQRKQKGERLADILNELKVLK